VLTFHNDIASTGLNANETTLAPTNVQVGSFGKLFTVAVDGQVYAEPLVDTGITIASGVNTKPGAPGVLVPFATLSKNVPPPFDKEWSGGMGQVIHDKFVVFDFNDANPMVFTGSSNLAAGGEQANGDNLLGFADSAVATAFAIEAFRLVDHFQFRAALQNATDVQPLQLSACGGTEKWWANDYDPTHIRNYERQLLALGTASAGSPPQGGVNTGAGTGTGTAAPASNPPKPKKPGKKTPAKKKTTTKPKTAAKKKTTASAKKRKPATKKKAAKPAPRKTTKKKTTKKASKKSAKKVAKKEKAKKSKR